MSLLSALFGGLALLVSISVIAIDALTRWLNARRRLLAERADLERDRAEREERANSERRSSIGFRPPPR